MSDFPITPQQDYLSIASATGRGFKQSILKSEINVKGVAPITAPGISALVGTPSSSGFLTFDGSVATSTSEGIIEASIVLLQDTPILAGTYILVLGLHNDVSYEYRYCYGPSNSNIVYQKFTYACAPGETLSVFVSRGDSAVTTLSVLDYNIRLY